MAKSLQKIEAQVLRSNGFSIKDIAKKLNVSVGSASQWCRNVSLSSRQIEVLAKRAHDPNYGKRVEYARKRQTELNEKISHLKEKGASEVGTLSKRDLFITGVALYWAEGFKKDSQLGFSNSDPKMINLFIKWLIVCQKMSLNSIRIRIVINESHHARIDEIQEYWSKQTGISHLQFQKPTFQKIVWKKKYENETSYFGVARIRVCRSTDLLRKVIGSIEGFHRNLSSN